MNNGTKASTDTSHVVTRKVEEKPIREVPLGTKIVGLFLLSPVVLTVTIALWAGFWKAARILVEWALG